MAARCDLTNKGLQIGHKVSHSQVKTKKAFKVNLQNVTLRSEILQQKFSFRIATSTLRTIEHNGGFDAFLTKQSSTKLTPAAVKIKRKIRDIQAGTKTTVKKADKKEAA